MLRVRWLGRVRYGEALALQRALFARSSDDYLLLLEHPHVYTLGVRGDPANILDPPASVGAELVRVDRGGDVTYHGPGQLVGYPIVSVPTRPGSTPDHVHGIEDVVIGALADLGLPGCGRVEGYPGVWLGERKICAVGVRVTRGRSMHGFALNVDPDLGFFARIVPCGLAGKGVTSLAAEGVRATMREAVDAVVARAGERWGGIDRHDVAWPVLSEAPARLSGESPPASAGVSVPVRVTRRMAEAGVGPGLGLAERKPPWLRVPARMGPGYRTTRRTVHALGLSTVCEEAGCPNIFECWADGTATFMINGDRCTRSCGFCLVDSQRPGPLDRAEPDNVAEAVARMDLSHAVVTAVARDDLPDGGAGAFAATVAAIRRRCPATTVEVLVPDCRGDPAALEVIFAAAPDVLNHNLETVARLQRAVRPSASYARSLAVLGRARMAGLTTKSGMMVGLGETAAETLAAMGDLRAVGVDVLTLGQYLRPSAAHLPVARWWAPDEFDHLRWEGERLGFSHVEAAPRARSSYHAKAAVESHRRLVSTAG